MKLITRSLITLAAFAVTCQMAHADGYGRGTCLTEVGSLKMRIDSSEYYAGNTFDVADPSTTTCKVDNNVMNPVLFCKNKSMSGEYAYNYAMMSCNTSTFGSGGRMEWVKVSDTRYQCAAKAATSASVAAIKTPQMDVIKLKNSLVHAQGNNPTPSLSDACQQSIAPYIAVIFSGNMINQGMSFSDTVKCNLSNDNKSLVCLYDTDMTTEFFAYTCSTAGGWTIPGANSYSCQ